MFKKIIFSSSVVLLALGFVGCGDDNNSDSNISSTIESNITTAVEDNASTTFRFTTDYLNGKTLYLVQDDDFGYDGLTTEWNMGSMTFSDNQIILNEIDLPTNPEDINFTVAYSIDTNGSIVATFEDEDGTTDEWILTAIDSNDTTIIAKDDEGTSCYLFLSQEEAKTFRDTKNAESTMSGFTTEFLNGKTLYYVTKGDFGYDNLPYEWNMAIASFTDTEITWQELVDGGDSKTFPYAIDENGSIIITWTNEEESGTFGFKLISSNNRAIHVLDIDAVEEDNENDDNGYFFFTEEYARAYMNRQNGIEEDDN